MDKKRQKPLNISGDFKSVSWHFLRLGLKNKKNKIFPGFLILTLQNISFVKFLQCIGCISFYLFNKVRVTPVDYYFKKNCF